MVTQIAELEARVAKAQNCQERIDALNDLAWELRNIDKPRALVLSEEAYKLASSGEFATQPYQLGILISLRSLAYLNGSNGRHNLCLLQCQQAFAILETLPQPVIRIDLLRILAWNYWGMGDYAVALDYGIQAMTGAQAIGDREREIFALDCVGALYGCTKKFELAISTQQKSLQLHQEIGDIRGIVIAANNLAQTYLDAGNLSDALKVGLETLQLAEVNEMPHIVLAVQETIGEIYLAQQDYDNGTLYLQKALTNSRQYDNRRQELLTLISLGTLSHRLRDFDSALTYYNQAFTLAEEISARSEQAQCCERLAETYALQGDYKAAFENHKRFHNLKETIFNEETTQKLEHLRARYDAETAKKDAEIFRLKNVELQAEIEERKKAQRAVEELAQTDPLTGLFNRRYWFDAANQELQSAIRYCHPFTVIILDIDHFKQINDTYGHAIGDEAIRFLATSIRNTVRSVDVVARFGGDEFVILLPETTTPQAAQIAERLRRRIEENPVVVNDSQIPLSLSLGVAGYSVVGRIEKIDTVLEQADSALYAAKQAGRNRVQVYT